MEMFHPTLTGNDAPNRIRATRMAMQMSQQSLADMVGVSKVTISSLELGKMQLTLDYMKRIACVFEISPLELMNDDEQDVFLREGEMTLLRAFRQAGEVQRKLIHRIAEPLTTATSELNCDEADHEM